MTRSAPEIRDWLVQRISGLTGLDPAELDVHEPLLRYGLDSVHLVVLAADLEEWLGVRFRENPLNDHPTIAALAQFLAEQSPQCG
jgi:acyl carrier protein